MRDREKERERNTQAAAEAFHHTLTIGFLDAALWQGSPQNLDESLIHVGGERKGRWRGQPLATAAAHPLQS